MKTVLIAALTIWLGAFRSQTARAQFDKSPFATFWTGNQLLQYCTGTNPAMRATCEGFTWGVADAAAAAPALVSSVVPLRACRPNGVDGAQVRDVVVQWLQAHPPGPALWCCLSGVGRTCGGMAVPKPVIMRLDGLLLPFSFR
jgi:hypothetical protein